jgi:hypothetical protein
MGADALAIFIIAPSLLRPARSFAVVYLEVTL